MIVKNELTIQKRNFLIKILYNRKTVFRRRNGVGWVGFWDRKPNPLKVWVSRVGLELELGWVGFFLNYPWWQMKKSMIFFDHKNQF